MGRTGEGLKLLPSIRSLLATMIYITRGPSNYACPAFRPFARWRAYCKTFDLQTERKSRLALTCNHDLSRVCPAAAVVFKRFGASGWDLEVVHALLENNICEL